MQRRSSTGRVRMVEVAARAGVSAVTVSRVLRTPEIVADDTRERVEKAVRELGYTPNLVARSLAGARSGMVAVVVPTIATPFYARVVRALDLAFQEARTELLLGWTEYDIDREERQVTAFLSRQADAILVAGASHSDATRTFLKGSAVPVVELTSLPAKPVDMAVGFDQRAAGKAITKHLLDRGAKHLAFLDTNAANATNDRVSDRRRGFEEAVKEAGRKAGAPVIVPCGNDHAGGAAAMAKVLEKHPKVDGVLGAYDYVAAGALFECQRRGVDVPGKIRIAGIDDLPEAEVMHPRLTSVRVDLERMGAEAARLVLAKLDGQDVKKRVVDIGFEVVAREST